MVLSDFSRELRVLEDDVLVRVLRVLEDDRVLLVLVDDNGEAELDDVVNEDIIELDSLNFDDELGDLEAERCFLVNILGEVFVDFSRKVGSL